MRSVTYEGKIELHSIQARHASALTWHSKALSAARSSVTIESGELLIRSVLFASLEFQQNNLHAGLELLRIATSVYAPLLTVGCSPASCLPKPYEVIETFLPTVVRNLCLIASCFEMQEGEFSDFLESNMNSCQYTLDHLERAVFAVHRTVYTMLKDYYFAIELGSESNFQKLESARLRLQQQAEYLTRYLTAHPKASSKRDALADYCSIHVSWMSILSHVRNDPQITGSIYLWRLYKHVNRLVEEGNDVYREANSTRYFYEMVITPVAYFVALMSPCDRLKDIGLKMSRLEAFATGRKPQLQYIALSTGNSDLLEHQFGALSIHRFRPERAEKLWLMYKTWDFRAGSSQNNFQQYS